MTGEFSIPVRVYMEDTDAGGIVYYVNYLKFMERARSEWLRELGLNQQTLLDEGTQALTVTANIAEKGRCRMTFEQQVRRDEELLCSATVEIACLNATTLRPKAWPLSLNTTPQSKTTLID